MQTPECSLVEATPIALAPATSGNLPSDTRLTVATFEDVCAVAAKMRDRDRRDICGRSPESEDPVKAVQELSGKQFLGATFWRDGEPVAVVAAVFVAVGAAGLFHFATGRWSDVKGAAAGFARDTLLPALRESGVTRVHAVTLADDPDEAEWLRSIGATEEARLERHGKNGEAYARFVFPAGGRS